MNKFVKWYKETFCVDPETLDLRGASHTPIIRKDVKLHVGSSHNLNLEYNKGPHKWNTSNIQKPQKPMGPCNHDRYLEEHVKARDIMDYRNHLEPAVVRDIIAKLKVEQYANATEHHLCRAMGRGVTALESYLELLDAMYLDSLHRHGLDLGAGDSD